MYRFARFFAAVVIFIAMLKSAAFGFFLGSTMILGVLLAVMNFSLDGFKVFLAPIVSQAWSDWDRAPGRAIAGTLLMAVLVIWGFGSAVGIAAKARFETSGSRATINRTFDSAQAEIKRLEAALETPAPRRVGEVDADLTKLKAQRIEGKTVQARVGDCVDLTSLTARRFCPDIKRLEAERASSEEWYKNEAALASLRRDPAAVTRHNSLDPQADVFSRITGFDLETVQMALMIAFGLIVELVGSLGLIAATPPIKRDDDNDKKPAAQTAEMVEVKVEPPVSTIMEPVAITAAPALPAPETSKPKPKAKTIRKKLRGPDLKVRFPQPVIRRTGVGAPTVLRPANRN